MLENAGGCGEVAVVDEWRTEKITSIAIIICNLQWLYQHTILISISMIIFLAWPHHRVFCRYAKLRDNIAGGHKCFVVLFSLFHHSYSTFN